jgi:hypothetical protein
MTDVFLPIDVTCCARCQKDHEKLEIKELNNSERYTHYAICPTNGQPILVTIIDDED